MEEFDKINWEPILWVAGGILSFFLLIISGLLTWIAASLRSDKADIKIRFEKSDEKFDKQQAEIHALALNNGKSIAVLEKIVEQHEKVLNKKGRR